MKKAFGFLLFALAAGTAALLAVLYKQKSEALAAAERRIAMLDQRVSSLAGAATPRTAPEGSDLAALRAQLAQSTAEVQSLRDEVSATRARMAEAAEAVPSAPVINPERSNTTALADALAGERAEDSAQRTGRQQALQEPREELTQLRRRLETETAWQAKTPALAELGRTLDKLPAVKVDFANRAVKARIVPMLLEQPQDLADVPGIGTVFEQRLYNAGIGTFWELAGLDDDQLRSILKFDKVQESTIDIDAIRGGAARLVEESGTQGYLWTGIGVDDFEPIKGIGKVYEQRLYDAGIRTYAALAQATAEELAAACQARSAVPPNYASWIEQARGLAGQI